MPLTLQNILCTIYLHLSALSAMTPQPGIIKKQLSACLRILFFIFHLTVWFDVYALWTHFAFCENAGLELIKRPHKSSSHIHIIAEITVQHYNTLWQLYWIVMQYSNAISAKVILKSFCFYSDCNMDQTALLPIYMNIELYLAWRALQWTSLFVGTNKKLLNANASPYSMICIDFQVCWWEGCKIDFLPHKIYLSKDTLIFDNFFCDTAIQNDI